MIGSRSGAIFGSYRFKSQRWDGPTLSSWGFDIAILYRRFGLNCDVTENRELWKWFLPFVACLIYGDLVQYGRWRI